MSMQRCFYYIKPRFQALNNRRCPNFPHRLHSTNKLPVDTDAHGIPVRPTWSVNQLLTSYPKPTISPSTLERLHVLSALVPPAEGTEEHKQLSVEMENLVKLVEAVKLVDTSDVDKTRLSKSESVPDGRIWAEGTGIDLSREVSVSETESPSGRVLLNHAARTENGMYVVDTDRRKK